MNADNIKKLQELRGVVATVVTTGDVKPQYAAALSNMRDFNSRNGFVNVEYKTFDAKLVEAGRDEVCQHAIDNNYPWLLMIDADAAAFPHDALVRLLHRSFIEAPQIDVVGAYSNLKQLPYLPTIDTGTGKWEVHYPGQGLLNVIRTGGHFILVKTGILKRMQAPWFRSRIPYTPLKAFAEMDNFTRVTLDGRNPLTEHPEWETLLAAARKASQGVTHNRVGEDSGFCDAVKAAGGIIAVDTDIVTGHVTSKVITYMDLKEQSDKIKEQTFSRLGVNRYV